jgi:hypothetical protein
MGALVVRRPTIRLARSAGSGSREIGLVLVGAPGPGLVLAKCRIGLAGRPATLRLRAVLSEALSASLFAVLLVGGLLGGFLGGLPGRLLGRGHVGQGSRPVTHLSYGGVAGSVAGRFGSGYHSGEWLPAAG